MAYKPNPRQRLERKLREELQQPDPNIEVVLAAIDEYEAKNLELIEKYSRQREVTIKRIVGGLRQTIHAHGPITKEFIGSAAKRVFGMILESPRVEIVPVVSLRKVVNDFIWIVAFVAMVIFIIKAIFN